jgi:uncharacterized membrane protein
MKGYPHRFRLEGMSLERIATFSDGVFAIIVTLLVLELRVPHLHDPRNARELAEALAGLLPKFLSWVASFLYVCVFWIHHHYIFRIARAADRGLVWLNNLFLLCHSFIPFPTALLGDYSTNPLAVSFFGVVLLVNALAIIALHAYVVRNLLAEGEDRAAEWAHSRRSCQAPVLFAFGAAMAWILPIVSLVSYLLIPLLFILPRDRTTQDDRQRVKS